MYWDGYLYIFLESPVVRNETKIKLRTRVKLVPSQTYFMFFHSRRTQFKIHQSKQMLHVSTFAWFTNKIQAYSLLKGSQKNLNFLSWIYLLAVQHDHQPPKLLLYQTTYSTFHPYLKHLPSHFWDIHRKTHYAYNFTSWVVE